MNLEKKSVCVCLLVLICRITVRLVINQPLCPGVSFTNTVINRSSNSRSDEAQNWFEDWYCDGEVFTRQRLWKSFPLNGINISTIIPHKLLWNTVTLQVVGDGVVTYISMVAPWWLTAGVRSASRDASLQSLCGCGSDFLWYWTSRKRTASCGQ